MAKNTKKKNSTARKLVPAAGMLMVSAAMLASSTYAWFTMSREVEVTNIKMTASVPEDLQISLGHLIDIDGQGEGDATQANASTYTGLTGNQGRLAPASTAEGATADNGAVKAPNTGNDSVSMLDWSSTADISEYYRLGRIIPASSTTGANIYFTPDAAGVGKTLKAGAKYYQAADIAGAKGETTFATVEGTVTEGVSTTKFYNTTLHAIRTIDETDDKWNDGVTPASTASTSTDNTYARGTEWNVTNDDGYFVDIPVWIRSSAKEDINLAVDAYVTTNAAVDEDDLYLAARAVILYNNSDVSLETRTSTTNPIRIRQDAISGTQSIVDYMYTTNSSGDAVSAVAAGAATYGDVTEYDGTQMIKVSAATADSNEYGTPTKVIVRVWLEGEDPNCWNQNAGQNFNISLKFSKDAVTPPATAIDRTNKAASTADGSLQNGARATVTSGSDTLVFEYDSTGNPKWDLIDGTFHRDKSKTYTFNGQTVTNSDDIAKQLEAMGTKASTFASTLTVSDE
jgi:hypothetical protein